MAGAEGIEPSARGFGVDVGKALQRSAIRPFQPLAGFRRFTSLHSDAFLMLLPISVPLLPRPSGVQSPWGRASQDTQNLRQRIQRIEISNSNGTNSNPLANLPTSGARIHFLRFSSAIIQTLNGHIVKYATSANQAPCCRPMRLCVRFSMRQQGVCPC